MILSTARFGAVVFFGRDMERIEIKIPQYAAELMQVLEQAGYEVWCVGGCVRDALMGVTPHDWDLCTSAMPDEMMKAFSAYRTIPTGLKHGTLTVLNRGEMVEITTYRCDGDYLDHRRPESVTFVRDIRSDLERRDFTMNAICMNIRGELFDPFDGEGDIKRGLIRCVGEPRRRFDEDALRIFRAVRFAAKTGFPIDSETLDAAMDMRSLLDEVSAERLYSELKSLLIQPHAGEVLRQYREIIAQVIPEVRDSFDFPQNNPHHCYDIWEHITHSVENIRPDPLLRTVMLLHDIGKPMKHTVDEKGVDHFKLHQLAGADMADEILRRLKSDTASRKRITALVAEHDNRIPAQVKSVKRFIAKYDYGFYSDWLEVRRADTLAQSQYLREEKLAELDELGRIAEELRGQDACLKISDLAVGGKELMALGYKGKEIGDLLKLMLSEVIEERLDNTPEALTDFAEARCVDET